ncbi:serine/threonine protein kinase [Tsukamurella sputi]|uniref:non-specific serine/threonine protein kinase n=1 Tax=Tsukamurella sputi TaxID=2591848 RepID=A0A5C5RUG5_9ACTN|nr:serine/threonine-protein kinase [Tsukamurella sputi]TWS25825.1 serine/threonine protein kinase [Tsukamurella sputi]
MSDELAPGTVIGGYRIERRLGSGGMGSVYLAKHPELPRYDALKVLGAGYSGDEAFRKRFLREAELAARLDHPNVVTIYNRGTEGQRLWIAMQYVQGDDCAVLLKRSPSGLEPATAVEIISQIGRGLDRAHRAGLLHRDIKPANILVSAGDDGDDADERRALLTDFGVAKGGEDTSQLTAVGTVLATLAYASPEQLCGEELDSRSDQYSLAATFFHLVTGKVPYTGASTDAVIDAHFNAPPPRISQIREGVPPAVDAVVARGLAKTPAERFATCKEFAIALKSAMEAPVSRPAPRPVPRPAPPGYAPGPGHPSGPQRPAAGAHPAAGPRPSTPMQRSVAPGIRGQANRPPYPASRPQRPVSPQPLYGASTGARSGAMPAPPAVPSGAMPRPSAGRTEPAKAPAESGMGPLVLVLVGVAVVALLVLILAIAFG